MDVDLSWAERRLHDLDGLRGELLVGAIGEDERPPRGLAGLVDWRLGGTLTTHCLSGFLTGACGEQFLLPGRPKLGFDRLLVIGLGPLSALDVARSLSLIEQLASTITELRVRRITLELPGRHLGVPSALEAINHWLDALANHQGVLESVTLVDDRQALPALDEARRKRGRRMRTRPRSPEELGDDPRSR